MRMGEFVNAVGSENITDNISSGPDGTKSMQSIKAQIRLRDLEVKSR